MSNETAILQYFEKLSPKCPWRDSGGKCEAVRSKLCKVENCAAFAFATCMAGDLIRAALSDVLGNGFELGKGF